MLPLAVTLPLFFALFALIGGWGLIAFIEDGWDAGRGNVWNTLTEARAWVWAFAGLGAVSGLGWALAILLPLKRYQAQLDEFVRQGTARALDEDRHSELSFLASSINRVMEEVSNALPERVQSILSSLSNGIVIIRPDGVIDTVNPAAERLLQVEAKDLEGHPYRDGFAKDPDLIPLIESALATESDTPGERVTVADLHGDRRTLAAWLAWVRDPEGRPALLSLTVMDQARLESFDLGLQSAESMSLLNNIARGMAHEIRNPLASIRGLAQLLSAGGASSPEKLSSYAEVMVGEVDRVDEVVRRLYMLAPNPSEPSQEVEVQEIFEASRRMAAHLAREKSVTIETELADPSATVFGVSSLLVQALSNLVVNGVEATPKGGWVKLVCEEGREGTVVFKITNSGSSIPPGELDEIFQPFHTTKANSAGLGLTITDSIARQHGGSVAVFSRAEETTFQVTLPREGKS